MRRHSHLHDGGLVGSEPDAVARTAADQHRLADMGLCPGGRREWIQVVSREGAGEGAGEGEGEGGVPRPARR